MSAHDHRTLVDGCFRCDLSRDEVDPNVGYAVGAWARAEALAAGDPDWANVTRWPRAKEDRS